MPLQGVETCAQGQTEKGKTTAQTEGGEVSGVGLWLCC